METPSAPSPQASTRLAQPRNLLRSVPAAAAALLLSGCSLVTVPVKTAGSVVNTAIKTTGSVAEAPFKAASGGYQNNTRPAPERPPSGKKE
jgi:hypothetical protein